MRSARGSSCRLSESNLLPPGAKFAFYRHHKTDLNPVFEMHDDLVCVVVVEGLWGALGCESDAVEWKLFADSSEA